jgi:hypothetical protein
MSGNLQQPKIPLVWVAAVCVKQKRVPAGSKLIAGSKKESCSGRRSLREAKKCPGWLQTNCGNKKRVLFRSPQSAGSKKTPRLGPRRLQQYETVIESFKNDNYDITTLRIELL